MDSGGESNSARVAPWCLKRILVVLACVFLRELLLEFLRLKGRLPIAPAKKRFFRHFESHPTIWRIIPFSKWLVTPIYKS